MFPVLGVIPALSFARSEDHRTREMEGEAGDREDSSISLDDLGRGFLWESAAGFQDAREGVWNSC
jgi:hypothetical protein